MLFNVEDANVECTSAITSLSSAKSKCDVCDVLSRPGLDNT